METTHEKLAWLRTMVAISLPQIEHASPESYARLSRALEETTPAPTEGSALAELGALIGAQAQAMGRAHFSDDEKANMKFCAQIMEGSGHE